MSTLVAPAIENDIWSERLKRTLKRYTDALLRNVADRLLRSRGKRTPSEMIEQCVAAPNNPVLLDRRLKELSEAARGLLAYLARFSRTEVRLGTLLELLSSLQSENGLAVVEELFLAGLLYPELKHEKERTKLRSFDDWLGQSYQLDFRMWLHPQVLDRMRRLPHPLPELPHADWVTAVTGPVQQADGLDPYLRLGLLKQWLRETPIRLTQAGDLFKRDLERLNDPLMTQGWEGLATEVPQISLGLMAYGLSAGWLRLDGTEVQDTPEPPIGLPADLAQGLRVFWPGVLDQYAWNPWDGWRGLLARPTPYATVMMMALNLLAQLPEDAWIRPDAVSEWMAQHHCYWVGMGFLSAPDAAGERMPLDAKDGQADVLEPGQGMEILKQGMRRFLEGWAWLWQLTQRAKDAHHETVVRLAPLGRFLLGLGPAPSVPEFPRTLLVQPNLEMIAYRQGLSPRLILELSRFATWRGIGPACMLLLEPAGVYHGLQSGCSYQSILQLLQKHSVKDPPDSVVQALRTWANKRERLSVYSNAHLLEFGSAEELEAALARGVTGERLADRFLLFSNEEDIDYRLFRLIGTRDYSLPSGPCVELGTDGLQLLVDYTKTDLLLEAELDRFAEKRQTSAGSVQRFYEMTPTSLQRARDYGLSLRYLEEWFHARVGQALSPAARLLYTCGDQAPFRSERLLIVQVADETTADGLMQWPITRSLIHARLGPTALVIGEESQIRWQEVMDSLPWKKETISPQELPNE